MSDPRQALLGDYRMTFGTPQGARVLADLNNPLVIFGYAAGVATGNVLGIMIEERLAVGHIQLQIISRRRDASVARALRLNGYGVTEIAARGCKRKPSDAESFSMTASARRTTRRNNLPMPVNPKAR